jgi:hypothetical protein
MICLGVGATPEAVADPHQLTRLILAALADLEKTALPKKAAGKRTAAKKAGTAKKATRKPAKRKTAGKTRQKA